MLWSRKHPDEYGHLRGTLVWQEVDLDRLAVLWVLALTHPGLEADFHRRDGFLLRV